MLCEYHSATTTVHLRGPSAGGIQPPSLWYIAAWQHQHALNEWDLYTSVCVYNTPAVSFMCQTSNVCVCVSSLEILKKKKKRCHEYEAISTCFIPGAQQSAGRSWWQSNQVLGNFRRRLQIFKRHCSECCFQYLSDIMRFPKMKLGGINMSISNICTFCALGESTSTFYLNSTRGKVIKNKDLKTLFWLAMRITKQFWRYSHCTLLVV